MEPDENGQKHRLVLLILMGIIIVFVVVGGITIMTSQQTLTMGSFVKAFCIPGISAVVYVFYALFNLAQLSTFVALFIGGGSVLLFIWGALVTGDARSNLYAIAFALLGFATGIPTGEWLRNVKL